MLLNTTPFTEQSSVSFNDVFSTTYDNYVILFQGTGTTTNASIRLRMRVSGADNTSSNYSYALNYADASPSSGVISSSGTTSAYLCEIYTRPSLANVTISNTFLTDYTIYIVDSFSLFSTATSNNATSGGGGLTVTTSYTGFTIFPTSGTMTGAISVYGYNK